MKAVEAGNKKMVETFLKGENICDINLQEDVRLNLD